jgi:pyruvate,orthophosphate dikinase
MIAAQGRADRKGGATSHAAVVARGMGLPCVCGCDALTIDLRAQDRDDRRRTVLAKATG